MRPDVSFHLVAVDFLPPAVLGRELKHVGAMVAAGVWQPLRQASYTLTSVVAAMRLLAQASHVGKVRGHRARQPGMLHPALIKLKRTLSRSATCLSLKEQQCSALLKMKRKNISAEQMTCWRDKDTGQLEMSHPASYNLSFQQKAYMSFTDRLNDRSASC
jgi:hypothetical protein